MKIGNREIGNGQPCYIIAEAGTSYARPKYWDRCHAALELVEAAHEAGADAVKFQMFCKGETLFCALPGDDARWKRWANTIMDLGRWAEIRQSCDKRGIDFLASAFQPTAVQWLKQLGVKAYKVASRAAAKYPYDAVPGPFIISDGMIGGSADAMALRRKRQPDSIWLQCRSKYPSPLAEAQWDWDLDYGDRGLSDHSGTIWPGLDAMARGCPILEVHFAIDKADAGNDAPVCLSVHQLKLLCEARDAFAEMRR